MSIFRIVSCRLLVCVLVLLHWRKNRGGWGGGSWSPPKKQKQGAPPPLRTTCSAIALAVDYSTQHGTEAHPVILLPGSTDCTR